MTQSSAKFIESLATDARSAFETNRRILSFGEFLDLCATHPGRYARNTTQYLLDALEHFGVESVALGADEVDRYSLFDAGFDDGRGRVVGNELTQAAFVRVLGNFVRERRANRLVMLHGPNGSAKSSFVSCLMRALEAYSETDEGALYTFSWVFPSERPEGSRIGFGGDTRPGATETYAYLDEESVDAKLAAEHNDNPLFLLATEARRAFLAGLDFADDFTLSDTVAHGALGHRSRQVLDALLHQYRGDLADVYKHVQVERYFISRRYRRGAVTVEPQMRVDAYSRQLTADRSLNALPAILQSQTLFESFGPLVEGNRGIVEYNDMLKRPMDANKYLLSTSEKGSVALDTSIVHLDALLIATANEKFLDALKQSPDWASYKGRFELVRMPYLLDYRAEQAIYDDLLDTLELPKPVAPHATYVAALWAVMTRLRRPISEEYVESIQDLVQNLAPDDKAKLYAEGQVPAGLSSEQTAEFRRAIPQMARSGQAGADYEGRFGASPREMKTLLLNAAHRDADTLSAFHVLEEMQRLVEDESLYEWLRLEADGSYRRPTHFIGRVRALYLDRVEADIQAATGLVDASEYERLFERYVLHAKHWLQKEKMTNPVTGKSSNADSGFMDTIENTLGRDEDAETFRSQIIARVAAFRIDNPDEAMDLSTIFPRYFEQMRGEYFASKRSALMTLQHHLLRWMGGEGESLETSERVAVERTLAALRGFGYTDSTSKEVIAVLVRERYSAGE